jgi:hypothetical protein
MNWLKLFNKRAPKTGTYEEFSAPTEIEVWVVEWNIFSPKYQIITDVFSSDRTRKIFYLEEDADEMVNRLKAASKFIQTDCLNIKKYKS